LRLTEEVPGSERCEVCTVRGNDRASLGEDEERVTRRTLACEAHALAGRLYVEPIGELPEVRVAQRAEERNGGEFLALAVKASNLPFWPPTVTGSYLTVTRPSPG